MGEVMDQATEELPQIEDARHRRLAVEDYINQMTNVELIQLLERAWREK